MIARSRARRMVAPVALNHGKEHWTIPDKTVRTWISFGSWPDGSYGPLVDPAKVRRRSRACSKKVDQKAVDATFYTSKGGGVVGVKPAKTGRKLDVAGTMAAVQDAAPARAGAGKDPSRRDRAGAGDRPAAADDRAGGQGRPAHEGRSRHGPPTTRSAAHNGFSANITIPSMAINGTVVAPGEWFGYWKTVGEVSLAKGYKLGGAIIDGHSVRGQVDRRRDLLVVDHAVQRGAPGGPPDGRPEEPLLLHRRYPKGLDATVFKSDGGGAQDMTFRNDTKYPILIRTYARPGHRPVHDLQRADRSTGSASAGRRQELQAWLHASVKYTTALRTGQSELVEYPADGQDVWVTRFVKDARARSSTRRPSTATTPR